jgi:Trypsin
LAIAGTEDHEVRAAGRAEPPDAVRLGRVEVKRRRANRLGARAPLALAALGLTLMLAPAAGASSGGSMRVILEKVRVRHGRPLHAGPRALRHRRHSRRAHAAIVGGSPISIAAAPWQVVLLAPVSAKESLVCGGSILNEFEVLTAGHCVIDPATKEEFLPGEITIHAGTADFDVTEPGEQVSRASVVRVHPYYVDNPEVTQAIPDDVAVVTLEKPLVLGTTAKKISLAPAGSPPQEGTPVNLTGFGAENALTGKLDGGLNSIGMTVRSSGECGGQNNALFVCASNPAGSDCFGDSGSALTVPGPPAMLTGVTDTAAVIEEKCFDGGVGGFANVAAPEIRDFIEGSATPPRAPRGGGDSSIQGRPTVGEALSCDAGSWSGAPTVTYGFLDSASGAVLQQGTSSVYPLTAADIGRGILCEVFAVNAGGTGIGRTATLGPVRPSPAEEADTAAGPSPSTAVQGIAGFQDAGSPVPDAKLASTALAASASGAVSIKITCPEAEVRCSGTVTLKTIGAVIARAGTSANAKAAVLTLAKGSFTVAGGKVKTVTLHLSAKARALLGHSHVMHVRATIVAHDQAGATHTTRTVVTLRSPKAKREKG